VAAALLGLALIKLDKPVTAWLAGMAGVAVMIAARRVP